MFFELYSLDVSRKWQMLFQDPGTPLMEGIVDFHHDIMFIIIFIVVAVLFMITVIVHNFTQTEKNETKAVMRGSHHTVVKPIFYCSFVTVPTYKIIPFFSVIFALCGAFILIFFLKKIVTESYLLFKAENKKIEFYTTMGQFFFVNNFVLFVIFYVIKFNFLGWLFFNFCGILFFFNFNYSFLYTKSQLLELKKALQKLILVNKISWIWNKYDFLFTIYIAVAFVLNRVFFFLCLNYARWGEYLLFTILCILLFLSFSFFWKKELLFIYNKWKKIIVYNHLPTILKFGFFFNLSINWNPAVLSVALATPVYLFFLIPSKFTLGILSITVLFHVFWVAFAFSFYLFIKETGLINGNTKHLKLFFKNMKSGILTSRTAGAILVSSAGVASVDHGLKWGMRSYCLYDLQNWRSQKPLDPLDLPEWEKTLTDKENFYKDTVKKHNASGSIFSLFTPSGTFDVKVSFDNQKVIKNSTDVINEIIKK